MLKAIDKDPRPRYQTAEEMAEDLRRFLADEPIRARPGRQLGAILAVGAAQSGDRGPGRGAHGGAGRGDGRLDRGSGLLHGVGRREASWSPSEQLANQQSQRDRKDAIEALTAAETSANGRRAAEVTRQNLYYAQMHLAQQAWREHRGLPHMRELLTNWLPQGESPDRRGWEWFYLNSLPYQNLRTLRRVGARPGRCTVAWHVASKRLAAGTADGLIRIWDVDREQTTLTLTGPGPAGPWWATRWFAWSPDGGELAAGFLDGTVHVWETRLGAGAPRLPRTQSSDRGRGLQLRRSAAGLLGWEWHDQDLGRRHGPVDRRRRTMRPASLRGMEPGRQAPRLRTYRRDGDHLGRPGRRQDRHAAGTLRLDLRSGVEPRRHPARLGERRFHREDLGGRLGKMVARPAPAQPRDHVGRVGARTVGDWRPAASTSRSRSGTRPRAARTSLCADRSIASLHWHGARTAAWPRGAMTAA